MPFDGIFRKFWPYLELHHAAPKPSPEIGTHQVRWAATEASGFDQPFVIPDDAVLWEFFSKRLGATSAADACWHS